MSRARITLVLSFTVLIVAVAVTLTGSPPRVVRVGVPSLVTLGSTTQAPTVCQSNESIPAGVSAIRIGLEGPLGPAVLLRAYAGGHVIAEGSRPGNWTDDSVTIPVKALKASVHSAKLCFYVHENGELLQLYGAHSDPSQAAFAGEQRLPGRFSVEYLSSSDKSWWSRARAVARHMGIGHAISGPSVAVLVALLAIALVSLMVRLAWKELA